MASKKKYTHSEKLDEIKQMQKSWMKQRADHAEDRETLQSQKKDRERAHTASIVKNTKAAGRDEGTISWVVSGGQTKKVHSRTLRSRSASPSNSKNQSQPSDKRTKPMSNPPSSRSNHRSRPPSGCPSSVHRPASAQSTGSRTKNHTVNEIKQISRSDQETPKSDTNPQANGIDGLLKQSLSESDLTEIIHEAKFKVSSPPNGTLSDEHNDRSEMCNREYHQSVSGANSGLLDPSQFDSLAERLSSKVRGHILDEEKKAILSRGVNQDSILLDEVIQSNSHACPKCRQTMVPPDHTPTLLIPCGHTFCEPCAEDRIKCPTCRTKVNCTSVNESLLKIILGTSDGSSVGTVHHTPQQDESTRPTGHLQTTSVVPGLGKAYNPLDFTGSKNDRVNSNAGIGKRTQNGSASLSVPSNQLPFSEFHSTFTPLKRHTDPAEQRERYDVEYESLSIRCEAYENEEEIILGRVENKSQEIQKQKSQITNINREQQRIKEEIDALQEKLTVLASHEQEFRRQCGALEEIKQGELEQLNRVRDTKKGLGKQREKIKFLGRGIGLFLD